MTFEWKVERIKRTCRCGCWYVSERTLRDGEEYITPKDECPACAYERIAKAHESNVTKALRKALQYRLKHQDTNRKDKD